MEFDLEGLLFLGVEQCEVVKCRQANFSGNSVILQFWEETFC